MYVCIHTHTSDVHLGEAGVGKAADGMRDVLEMAVRCAPTVSTEEALESGEIRHKFSKSTLCRAVCIVKVLGQ
jgi:hypothetical protein